MQEKEFSPERVAAARYLQALKSFQEIMAVLSISKEELAVMQKLANDIFGAPKKPEEMEKELEEIIKEELVNNS